MATNIFAITHIRDFQLGKLASGVDTSTYDTNAVYTLGEVAFGIDGKVYRYVKFLDAVTYVAGHVVTRASASAWHVTNDRSGGSAIGGLEPVGVALGVPAENEHGWVQIGGLATVLAGATITAGQLLTPDASTDGAADRYDDALADATASHTVTDPGDTPASVDALRDDLVANTIPSIEADLDALGTKINAVIDIVQTVTPLGIAAADITDTETGAVRLRGLL